MPTATLQETLRGKRVLLTGSTGFLGKVWLEMALRLTPEIGHVYLLARAGRAPNAANRLETIFDTSPVFRALRQHHKSDFSEWLKHRITVLDGDVAVPNFGLSEHDATALAAEVDLVMNFAGVTDFQPDPKLAEQVNIQGALNAADFAAKYRLNVSYMFRHAMWPVTDQGEIEETLIPGVTPNGKPFDPAQEHETLRQTIQENSRRTASRIQVVADHVKEQGWPNIYTYSKALAEHLLWQRTDIALTLARPSIVECAVQAPFAGWNEGINTSAPLSWLIASYFLGPTSKAQQSLRYHPSRYRCSWNLPDLRCHFPRRGTACLPARKLRR